MMKTSILHDCFRPITHNPILLTLQKESNQVKIEDGSTVIEVEKYSQLNQNGLDKAMSCAVNVHTSYHLILENL